MALTKYELLNKNTPLTFDYACDGIAYYQSGYFNGNEFSNYNVGFRFEHLDTFFNCILFGEMCSTNELVSIFNENQEQIYFHKKILE